MRFLFFAAQYLPTIGGVERYTQSLALELVTMGHTATVVTSALPGLPTHEISDDGIQVYRLPAHLVMNGRFPILHKNAAFRRATQSLWSDSYDFALINTRFYPLSLWAAKQCGKRAIPALVLEHGTKHLSLDNKLIDILAGAYEHFAMRRVRRWCARFYGVSRACSEWLLHFGVRAQGVLYNAVDPAALRATKETSTEDFRHRFNLPANTPLVAFSGRMIREKGIWELADAMRDVCKKLPATALIMAGDGPSTEALAARAYENVFFTGPLPHNDNLALISQADVLCLPSYSEGFSTIVLEAAALGCCIVTTATGGSPELISNAESGILLETHKSVDIATALIYALEHPNWLKTAGEAASQTVTKKFTWSATANQLLTIATKELIV